MKHRSINIIGRIDGKTGISQHTSSFLSCLADSYDVNFLDTRPETSDHSFLPLNVNSFTSYHECLSSADVSIFVDVTSNGSDDLNWQKVPVTRLKYIYSVFDSTEIPIEWADIINGHFDAVFVPSRFLIDVYRNSKVQKPIFYLPLALDLSPYLELNTEYKAKNSPFVFTFIGSREKRKNLETLIECFASSFLNRNDVVLRIHSALDFYNQPDFATGIMKRYSNIRYTTGNLNANEYKEIINESDCFVSLSKGEGYSIVPRQFLAAGKPVVLSDCFAHSEILKEINAIGPDLAFGVDASIPEIGVYDHINGGGIYGIQYSVYKESVCDTLIQVFNKQKTLLDKKSVLLRKEWAKQYDINALKSKYCSVVDPAFCRMSTGNELEFGGITTSDANLASRMNGKNFSLSGWQEVNNTQKKIVVVGNDGGFFSVFNRFVSYLTWALSENPNSVVLPDWRVDSMKRHWKTDKFISFCYGKPSDGNVWLKLFKPLPNYKFDDFDYNDDSRLLAGAEIVDDFNEKNEPWLTYIHAYKLYKSVGFQRWRHWYNLYFSTYVHLQDDIQQKIDRIYNEHLKGYVVISAHIRHPSHGIEQAGSRMPTVELYCEKIKEIMINNELDERNCRIFLATDQDSVVDIMKNAFPEILVYSSEAARTTTNDDLSFSNLSLDKQMKEGHQIQHLTANNPDLWSTKMAEDVIVDAYLLAKGDFFIHVTSNIATAVSFINPRVEMVYCE